MQVKSYPSQEELLKVYEWFETIPTVANLLIWDWDLETNIVQWNDVIYTMYGYSHGEVEDSFEWWQKNVHPDDKDAVGASLDAAINSGKMIWSHEYRFKRQSGSYSYSIDKARILRDSQGKAIRLLGVMQDISARKTAEHMAEQNQKDFKYLAASIPQLIWVARPDGYHEYFNKQWLEYTNQNFSDSRDIDWKKIIHPDHYDKAWKLWERSLKTGEDYEIEYKLCNGTTKEYRWFLGRAIPIKNEKGKITKWFGTCTDIHHQKLTTQFQTFLSQASKILASSFDYKETLDSVVKLAVPEIADWCSIDLMEDGELELIALAHKDPKKVRWAKKLRSTMPPDLTRNTGVAKVIQTGKSEFYPVITEKLIKDSTKDKKVLALIKKIGLSSMMIVPIIVEGKTIGVIQFTSSESKKHFLKQDLQMAEGLAVRVSFAIHNAQLYDQAQKVENRFKSLYESNIVGVIFTRTDGTLISANSYFLDMLGFTEEDLQNGINLKEQTPIDQKQKQFEYIKELNITGMLQPFEKEYIRKDGSKVPVIVGSVMQDFDKQEVLSFVLDITERKKLEQRKDEFIGIASHELRTPLTTVKGYIQILERIIQQMGDDKLNTYVKKTNVYIDKLNSLISELLDVSKMQAGKLQLNYTVFEIEDVILDTIDAVQSTIRSHLILYKGGTNKKIKADRNRLEQVLTNLLANAVKYSPKANQITVETKYENNEVIVSVKDSGVGIPLTEIPKLFQRFYRVEATAEQFSGLGIGLFISSEIIQRHNGRMWVESKESEGSTFSFALPAYREK